jgi:hypothetical protein
MEDHPERIEFTMGLAYKLLNDLTQEITRREAGICLFLDELRARPGEQSQKFADELEQRFTPPTLLQMPPDMDVEPIRRWWDEALQRACRRE